jgi:hypothetical protein
MSDTPGPISHIAVTDPNTLYGSICWISMLRVENYAKIAASPG